MANHPSRSTKAEEAGRQALLQELAGEREAVLQACWAHQTWQRGTLRTAGDLPLEVEFPGWLNRGPGPDFSEARVNIGNDHHFGSVEIHVREEDWRNHGHQQDSAYDNVILHVVLRRSDRVRAESPGGAAIQQLLLMI